jgi:Ca-activated chloride channel family protein
MAALVFALAAFVVSGNASRPMVPPPPGGGQSEGLDAPDKTLSPYFFVKSDDPSVDQLPLKSTSAVVEIAGVIADVTVTQVYKNEGKKPLEAIYVFPASTKAAVYGMKMTIGERTLIAQIQKRDEARAAYEQAKKEGKSASLLEQQRPNVFQMNVANILPGDEIKTELRYTELITPAEGVYEFVYPTVVGPRYSNQPSATAPPSEKWVQNPYLHSGEAPSYSFDIKARLSAGVSIQEMTCTSHKTDIQYDDPASASVQLSAGEKSGGNKDFILKYRLTGDKIQSGLLLYEGDKEKFFLLMVQPPKRVNPSAIPPREYIFIVDVSGSMHGFPLEISKGLLKDLIGKLRPTDIFNVLLFAGASEVMAEQSLAASPENVRRAVDLIDRQRGGGGTELLPALKRALALPRREGISRTVVMATDGYVSVETEAFDLIKKELGRANFFTFGIGSSVNRFLIEGMARVGAGEPFVVTKPDEAPARAEKFRQTVQSPLLTQIRLDFGGFQAYDVEPAGGVPDVFAERPVVIHGKWRGNPEGTITLKGVGGEKPYSHAIQVAAVKPLKANSALRYLWARSRIAELSDYNLLQPDDQRIKQITQLGLDYNLLTAYTSFVAIDSEVRRKDGDVTTVKQPLPLPEGVSDYAVGGAAGTMMMRAQSMASPMLPSTVPHAREKAAAVEPTKKTEAESSRDAAQKAGKGPSELTVRVKKVEVPAGLSEEGVKQVVESRLEELKQCISTDTRKRPPREVVLTVSVDPAGKVSDVRSASKPAMGKDMERCIQDTVKAWIFAAPGGNAPVIVKITLSVD